MNVPERWKVFWQERLSLVLKENVMECKEKCLYWRENKGKGQFEMFRFFLNQLFPLNSRQLFREYKHKFLLRESLHLCLLPSGFNTGVYCRASSLCMTCYQHHFISCLRPSRCLTSRDLPFLLLSVAFLELTFLLRWRNKKLKCLQQKDLPAGWRSSSQPRQRQCQRLGKREVLWPPRVLWKTTASLQMTLENPFWQPETAEVKPFATAPTGFWDLRLATALSNRAKHFLLPMECGSGTNSPLLSLEEEENAACTLDFIKL